MSQMVKVVGISNKLDPGWYFREYPNEWQPIPDEKAVIDALNSGADSVDLGNGWRGCLFVWVEADGGSVCGASLGVYHWDDIDCGLRLADLEVEIEIAKE